VHLWAFIGVAAVVILTPGPDFALVTKNALLHGRRAALGSALGVNAGILLWTVAAAFGVTALVRASGTAFTVLKLIGAAYLIYLGVHALRAAGRALALDTPRGARVGSASGFRQGLLSNVANPKIAVFFTSLLPQFVASGTRVPGPFLVLGGVFVVMNLFWMCGYAVAAARASALLRRPAVKTAMDRLSGVVLIGLGVRLATERR
jgi:threonine/homoserine/homoserine lactone efflux protein